MPTLGFWTFDAGPTGAGTKRVNWLWVDFDILGLVDPALSPPVQVFAATVCVPLFGLSLPMEYPAVSRGRRA